MNTSKQQVKKHLDKNSSKYRLNNSIEANMKKCKHQWFELRKISETYTELDGGVLDEQKVIGTGYLQGVLIKCANCEQQKELWDNKE